jgi:hypothetical protein
MTLLSIATDQAPKPRGHYQQSIKAAGFVHVLGRLPGKPPRGRPKSDGLHCGFRGRHVRTLGEEEKTKANHSLKVLGKLQTAFKAGSHSRPQQEYCRHSEGSYRSLFEDDHQVRSHLNEVSQDATRQDAISIKMPSLSRCHLYNGVCNLFTHSNNSTQ